MLGRSTTITVSILTALVASIVSFATLTAGPPSAAAQGQDGSGQQGAGQQAADQRATGRPAIDRPATDRPATDRPATDRPGADRHAADEVPRVKILLLPNGTQVAKLARIEGLSLGLMSAGLGRVLPDQTYLDIGQGARAFNSLYDRALPLVYPRGDRVPDWRQIRDRAASAPGEIRPGLFASTLNRAPVARGVTRGAVQLVPELVVPALMGADERGRIARNVETCTARRCRPPVLIRDAPVRELPRYVAELERDDLLIAFERPPSEGGEPLTLAIAGAGFDGNLTSDSTRMDGYVLSTDLAPTVLDRFGVEIPSAMTGRPIEAQGGVDAAALIEMRDRMVVVAPRRGPVIGASVMFWLALVAIGALFASTRRPALRLLTLTAVYLPLLLLLTSALRPDEGVERLIVLLGAPALAAFTARLLGPWRDLAVACGLTVFAYAADMVAGSPLTSMSLLGPNPGLGVRFYGIGNELGATLTMLILLGSGSAIAGFRPNLDRRAAAAVFLAVAIPLAIVFSAGRFGAGVGSAMVIPAGAVVAAAIVLSRPFLAVAALAAPVVAIGVLVAVDSITGGNSHFQRTVLDADGLDDLLDTLWRRLRLTGRSFIRAASGPFLPLTVLVIGLAGVYRDRVKEWVGEAPGAFGAGFGAAIFATVLGTAVNDSGVLLLEVGTAYLLLFSGYAWSRRR